MKALKTNVSKLIHARVAEPGACDKDAIRCCYLIHLIDKLEPGSDEVMLKGAAFVDWAGDEDEGTVKEDCNDSRLHVFCTCVAFGGVFRTALSQRPRQSLQSLTKSSNKRRSTPNTLRRATF